MSPLKITDAMVEAAQHELFDTERKFRKACLQLIFLNKRINNMKARYKKAKTDNFNRFRYNLRLKLAVVEGVRNMYYEYAHMKAEQVADIRRHLFGDVVEIIDDVGDDANETVAA
jgi:hypothetical protein